MNVPVWSKDLTLTLEVLVEINTVLAAVAVTDVETAVTWYETFLGQPPTPRPMPILAEWHVEAGHLQLVQDPERAGTSLLTLDVNRLDQVAVEVADAELVAEPLDITHGDTVRFAQILDPDGNTITLVETPTGAR